VQSVEFDIIKAQRRIFESNLGSLERLVALAILDFWSRKSPKPFPSLATLQERTALSRNAVLSAIRGLERAGAIAVKRVTGISSTYDLNGLMSLPVHDANRFTRGTGSPDEPVHDTHPTGSPEGPPPVPLVNPKDPTEGTQRRNPRSRAGARNGSPKVQGSLLSEPEQKPDGAEHQAVVACYFECYRAEHHADPSFDGEDARAAKTLRKKAGSAEEACRRIKNAFQGFRRSNVTLKQIARDPDQFKTVAPESKRTTVQDAPVDEEYFASLGRSKAPADNVVALPVAGGAK
jgi:hypothetical protein